MRTIAAALALAILLRAPSATVGDAQSPSPDADANTLEVLLERAGAYFLSFEQRFSNVVTEEHYLQESVDEGQAVGTSPVIARRGSAFGGSSAPLSVRRRRELVSDFLLVRPSDHDRWLPFRDVFEVDRQRLRDRDERLSKLFLTPAAGALDQARRIMDESARYNIGDIDRTINLPVFALEALRPGRQAHIRFSRGKRDPSVGPAVYIVAFAEQVPPTLIQAEGGRDLYSHGRFWIDAPTGRVLKSELIVDDAKVHASSTTRYRVDAVYGVAVPVDMTEEYSLPNGSRVTGTATYGHFRSFGVRVADDIATPPRFVTDAVTGMTLVEVPPGHFVMGSPRSEAGRRDDETAHEVTISKPFLLGRFEVTQEQWRAVMGTSPGRFGGCGSTCPVEGVSHDDVRAFLDELNRRAKGVRFRLPTEAEWEYACRAGATAAFGSHETITTARANYNGRPRGSADLAGLFREAPTPAGTFDVNIWGLADMQGNVREWTAAWYGAYASGTERDPRGSDAGTMRIVRGGGWNSNAEALRCAAREKHAPRERDDAIGFRAAADVTPLPRER